MLITSVMANAQSLHLNLTLTALMLIQKHK